MPSIIFVPSEQILENQLNNQIDNKQKWQNLQAKVPFDCMLIPSMHRPVKNLPVQISWKNPQSLKIGPYFVVSVGVFVFELFFFSLLSIFCSNSFHHAHSICMYYNVCVYSINPYVRHDLRGHQIIMLSSNNTMNQNDDDH